MASKQSRDIALRASNLYEQRLKARLETDQVDSFVAIEPDSGDYFLGATLSEAIQSARIAHPDRLSFALHIGHASTVNLGLVSM